MPTTLILDCETVCSIDDLTDADALTLAEMANKRDIPVDQFVATCPALARVVLVGMQNADTGGRWVGYDASLLDVDDASAELTGVKLQPCGGEHGVLIAVHEMLSRAQRLVGFNSRSFDLPLLLLRAMRHGVAPAKIVERAMQAKPWEMEAIHLDMLHRLSFGGATGRYGLAAYELGLIGSNCKRGGDGAKVGELVKARNGTDLAAYCLGDCGATLSLAVKAGVLDLPAAQREKAA